MLVKGRIETTRATDNRLPEVRRAGACNQVPGG
jgi:hypothetical protein